MLKTYMPQASLLMIFFASGLPLSAADNKNISSSEPKNSIHQRDPLGLRAQAAARYAESSKPKLIFSDEEFDQKLAHYVTDLPSAQEAETTVQRIMRDHKDLQLIVQCLKDPHLFKRVKYPSRLLFVGPSGCGKTTAAKALAKYCEADCVFVKGSAVGNTYQNSGATVINDLFKGLLERPSKKFMVIIDEFITVAQFIADSKDVQQNKTATALWQALDDCVSKRHICVIGTDNGDPEKLADSLKTRFAHNIFIFGHMQPNDIVDIMKQSLGSEIDEQINNQFLTTLAKSVKHLSIREIEDLIEKSKMLAIAESQNPDAIVTKDHLISIFKDHKELGRLQKIWKDRAKHVSNFTSVRAFSLYIAILGGCLQFSNKYRKYGIGLVALAAIMNQYWPKDEKEANDLPFFSMISHLFAQEENHNQWETSHEFNVHNAQEARIARKREEERAEYYAKKADERGEWDKKFRVNEAITRLATGEPSYRIVGQKAEKKQRIYLKQEHVKLNPEQYTPKPAKEMGGWWCSIL